MISPLGKDFSDPDGKDDDWQKALLRTVFLPKGRPVEIDLSSRDVIHDFFVPEFRIATKDARRVLPASLSRADAVHNIGRAALLPPCFPLLRPRIALSAVRGSRL